jgi:hypothetical protein
MPYLRHNFDHRRFIVDLLFFCKADSNGAGTGRPSARTDQGVVGTTLVSRPRGPDGLDWYRPSGTGGTDPIGWSRLGWYCPVGTNPHWSQLVGWDVAFSD